MDKDIVYNGSEIAIVGMACRFPGASSVDDYWANLRDGIESIRFFSEQELRGNGVPEKLIRDPNYVPANGVLDDIEYFDAGFFGFSPREAAIMDPQHRFFLECCWEALEHAGYDPAQFDGSIGVFAGSGMTAYMMYNLVTNPELMHSVGEFLVRHTGNDKDFLTTRASYLFNLKGPSINVQTACSTSLVAVHLASQHLLSGECDMALAGGVTIQIDQQKGYLYQDGEILSPDGHCRAFDADAEGTVFGSGVGLVVLKRLDDAIRDRDTIHSIVRGSAVNNDGSVKVSYLAPSVDGQAQAIAEAIEIAEVDPASVTYVEAHGTGTPVGDPIELAALTQAYGSANDKRGYCALGSVKTNIGHLDTAAGVASLIKASLAISHAEIPPTLHYNEPNPKLGIENSPFFVNNRLVKWTPPGGIRRAGVSSLGVGGTNAHVILEQAPSVTREPKTQKRVLVPLSARSESAVLAAAARLRDHLVANPGADLDDVAYTMARGRRAYDFRTAVSGKTIDEVIDALSSIDRSRIRKAGDSPTRIFMFAGGGAQHRQMGAGLYRAHEVYRNTIDRCIAHMKQAHGVDLKPILVPDANTDSAEPLQAPLLSLPALFSVEFAAARLLMSLGIRPDGMTGHSMGEYVAACLSGVFSLEDALSLVYTRGRLFETLDAGAMLSVFADRETVLRYTGEELSIAAQNAPTLNVVAGPVASIERLEQSLTDADIDFQRVRIDVAAHSAMVESILDAFHEFVSNIQFSEPGIPFISNVTGTWITADEAMSPEYWTRHIRETVRFSDGIATLLESANPILIEVGPGRTLATLADMHRTQDSPAAVTTMRHPKDVADDDAVFFEAVGAIWGAGATPEWGNLLNDEYSRRIPLPTYPFERSRYWIEPGKGQSSPAPDDNDAAAPHEPVKSSNVDDWIHEIQWRPMTPPVERVYGARRWLVFANAAPDGLLESLQEPVDSPLSGAGTSVHVVRQAEEPAFGDMESRIRPGEKEDYFKLLSHLVSIGQQPTDILNLWPTDDSHSLDAAIDRNFFSLLWLAQAAVEVDLESIRVYALSESSLSTSAKDPVSNPAGNLVAGPCGVIGKEVPAMEFSHVDVGDRSKESIAALVTLLKRGPAAQTVAVRSGRYLTANVEKRATPLAHDTASFRKGATYVITGGAGGISTALADLIGQKYGARIVLVGRTPLPDKSVWAARRDKSDLGADVEQKVARMAALSRSIDVDYVAADVTDRDAIRRAFNGIVDTFGEIDGVLHAAGLLDDGPALAKTAGAARSVLAPKTAGALAVIDAAKSSGARFVELFSSTSAVIAAAGQVDYVSANSFMDSLAASVGDGVTAVRAIRWGMWRNLGMTSRPDADSTPDEAESLDSHVFSSVLRKGSGSIYQIRLSTADHWFVNEHRLWTGQALAPGTLIVELVRSAIQLETGRNNCRITDLVFAETLSVPDGVTVNVGVEVTGTRNGNYDVVVTSEQDGLRVDHAFASAGPLEGPPDEDFADRYEQDLRRPASDEKSKQERWLDFGPRWHCLESSRYGSGRAEAVVELPDSYRKETLEFGLHPALLDIATGFALPLDSGYESHEDLYVPITYREIRTFGTLPPRFLSHARLATEEHAHPDFVTIDYRLVSEDGTVVAAIDGFAMKRVDAAEVARALGDAEASLGQMSLLDLGARFGIEPEEGLIALERCLSLDTPAPIVSSIRWSDVQSAVERSTRNERPASESSPTVSAEKRIGPRDAIERSLVDLWASLLGVTEIGIKDDFFDLGGHSLIAVRLFTRIRRDHGVDLSLATLFQAPTIEKCAALIRSELGLPEPQQHSSEGPSEASNGSQSVEGNALAPRRSGWTPLVPIRESGTRMPFYCVHGAGGNVLNFTSLSRLLGPDQPFFGLQARGVDGIQEPAATIEEMAEDYVDAVVSHDPDGPYLIGGYSGGGVVAFEMAKRLRARNKQVRAVVMLDTFCPTLPKAPQRPGESKVSRHLSHFRQSPVRYLGRYALGRYRFERNRLRKTYANFLTKFGRPLPIELREFKMISAYHAAQDRYQPSQYDGKVILITAETREAEFSHVGPDMGWAQWIPHLEVITSPGDHDTLFREPHVIKLVEHFNEAVDRLTGMVGSTGDGAGRGAGLKSDRMASRAEEMSDDAGVR